METPAAKLVIKDRDGVIPIRLMRDYFERAMRSTDKFSSQPLGTLEGEQLAYANDETSLLWTGFALGMRCAERIHQAAAANFARRAEEEGPDTTCRYCDNDEDLIGCGQCGSELCKFHWEKYGGCCVSPKSVSA